MYANYYFRYSKILKLNKQLDKNYLATTYHVVLVLAKTLLYTAYEFNIFINNLFTNLKLFSQLQKLEIRAYGIAWNNVVNLAFANYKA